MPLEIEETDEICESDEVVERKIDGIDQGEIETNNIFIKYTFIFFMIIWTFLVAINRLYLSTAFPVLLIPYASFGIGFINSDQIADDRVESDIFSTTFITVGLMMSIPLLTFFNREKSSKELNHVVFLAMIAVLLSYLHIWGDGTYRHVSKISRSCLETIAITLYIFVLTNFFLFNE